MKQQTEPQKLKAKLDEANEQNEFMRKLCAGWSDEVELLNLKLREKNRHYTGQQVIMARLMSSVINTSILAYNLVNEKQVTIEYEKENT